MTTSSRTSSACNRPAARPDVVVLLPWGQRLHGRGEASAEVVEDEVSFWRQAWGLVTGGLGARLIQVGYDWVTPGPLGYHVAGRAGARSGSSAS